MRASEGTNPCTRPSFATKNVFDVLQDLSESIGGSPGPQLDAADGQPEPIVHDLHQSLVELLGRPEILSLHAVRRVGRERQLHLKVRALCGEVAKVFDVLVDRGAQVSLVKAGLLPPECLTDSRIPVRLKVANGQYMVGLYTAIKKVRKGCSVCQACNPDNRNVKGEAQWTPVPDQPMESVAMDVFSMPEVHIGKETLDCVVLCVDRHSGYVVAVPARKKGLLAKEVAVMMIRHWLTVFDIPRTICSDRGPQFTGGWFKAMCSLMGIRHAKSVAYLSRSNGRAEVAERQLFEKLRKIHITNPRRNWFEEMWPALKAHHDTPTPGGLSPHQILFGRDPLGRGLPLSGDGMAMDAKEFFARQEQTARDIRQQLEKEHAERQKSAPSSTAQKFRVGDPVWVIRPRPMGTHRTKTWFTPGKVVRNIGEDTYRIKVGHGQFRERHESQLRVREPDLRGQHVSLSYAAHEADSDDDYAERDDYTVEKILAQRPKASAPGGLEFKVRWRGYGPSHDTWEPVSSFVPRVNTPFMEYIRKHKTKIHVSDLAALPRAIAARGA